MDGEGSGHEQVFLPVSRMTNSSRQRLLIGPVFHLHPQKSLAIWYLLPQNKGDHRPSDRMTLKSVEIKCLCLPKWGLKRDIKSYLRQKKNTLFTALCKWYEHSYLLQTLVAQEQNQFQPRHTDLWPAMGQANPCNTEHSHGKLIPLVYPAVVTPSIFLQLKQEHRQKNQSDALKITLDLLHFVKFLSHIRHYY